MVLCTLHSLLIVVTASCDVKQTWQMHVTCLLSLLFCADSGCTLRGVEHARLPNDISNKCWAAGHRFWPIVHEVEGGMAKGVDAAKRAISEAVGKTL